MCGVGGVDAATWRDRREIRSCGCAHDMRVLCKARFIRIHASHQLVPPPSYLAFSFTLFHNHTQYLIILKNSLSPQALCGSNQTRRCYSALSGFTHFAGHRQLFSRSSLVNFAFPRYPRIILHMYMSVEAHENAGGHRGPLSHGSNNVNRLPAYQPSADPPLPEETLSKYLRRRAKAIMKPGGCKLDLPPLSPLKLSHLIDNTDPKLDQLQILGDGDMTITMMVEVSEHGGDMPSEYEMVCARHNCLHCRLSNFALRPPPKS